VQQESVDDAERNHFLVNYVDCAFDDFGGSQPPVYPGLSTVWGSFRLRYWHALFLLPVLACSLAFIYSSTPCWLLLNR